jgi:hypothetical protein
MELTVTCFQFMPTDTEHDPWNVDLGITKVYESARNTNIHISQGNIISQNAYVYF